MSDALTQDGHFEPIHAAHAIEQVAFVLQFDHPFDDAVFSKLRIIADGFKEELPGKVEIQAVSFSLGMQPITQQSTSNGLVLRRMAPDGSVEIELRIERASLTFITTCYSRWQAAWIQASKYFNTVLPLYLDQAKLTAISLNYIDKFVWVGNLDNCVPNLLIRPETKYICKHIFDTKDFWHSHTGSFIRVNKFIKRLLNINVDYLDETRPEGTKRIIAITTVVTDQFNQPSYEEFAGDQNATIEEINKRMQDMHNFGKQVFSDLITSQMSQRIALKE
jgi:uncharacterized protein (TIGR04255 family)